MAPDVPQSSNLPTVRVAPRATPRVRVFGKDVPVSVLLAMVSLPAIGMGVGLLW